MGARGVTPRIFFPFSHHLQESPTIAKARAIMTEKRDFRPTVFLPKTDFPMKAGLPRRSPAF
jgi:isoleucyl-tRNA synthetase